MTKIYVGATESIENAIRRFRKKCDRDGISRELKRRAFYEKPSIRKKKKMEILRRKIQKRLRRQNFSFRNSPFKKKYTKDR